MEIVIGREMKFNMGNYEHWQEYHRVTVGDADLVRDGIDIEGLTSSMLSARLISVAMAALDTLAENFIKGAALNTANVDSFSIPLSTTFDQQPPAPAKKASAATKKARS